jgi:hypothetical protein
MSSAVVAPARGREVFDVVAEIDVEIDFEGA